MSLAKDGEILEAIIVIISSRVVFELAMYHFPGRLREPESFPAAEKLILLSILLATPTSGKQEAMNGDGGIVWI